jgi:hypothetical protein
MSINPAHMKKFICGVLVGICLPFVVAYVFVAFGGMPVATKGQPLPLERFIAGKALHAAMDRDVGKPSPLPLDEVNLLAGARLSSPVRSLPRAARSPGVGDRYGPVSAGASASSARERCD